MSVSSKKNKIKLVALSGVFAAMIFAATMIHIPTGSGYTHAGDGIIYLSASLMPPAYAMAASAIGGALADGLSGAAIWMPATVIIKMLTALFFTSKKAKIISLRNIFGIIPSFLVCAAGYGIYEAQFILGGISRSTVTAAMVQLPSYFIQSAASSVLYIAVGLFLDRSGFRKNI